MAAFPSSLSFGIGSKQALRTGREIDLDGDGLARVRKMHADRADFNLTWPALNATELAVYTAFYAANSGLPFDLTWADSVTYQCVFAEPPHEIVPLGAGLYRLNVFLKAA